MSDLLPSTPMHEIQNSQKTGSPIFLNKQHIVAIRSEWVYSKADKQAIDEVCRIHLEVNPLDIYFFKGEWFAVSEEGQKTLDSIYSNYSKIEYHIIKDSQGEVYILRPGEYEFFG